MINHKGIKMKDNNQFTFIDESGKEVLCEILFAFESEEFKKEYIFFFPVNMDDFGLKEPQIMAALVDAGEQNIANLQPVTSEEEWEMLEGVLDQFFAEYEKEHHHDCGCGHDHNHDHHHAHSHAHDHKHEHECECGHDHGSDDKHEHKHDCECGHDHAHTKHENCNCKHDDK